MKKHNGGAITVKCDFLSDEKDAEFSKSSGFLYGSRSNQTVYDLFDRSVSYSLNPNMTLIENCEFEENFSGFKGMAIYAKYYSDIVVNNCKFWGNSAVYAYQELNYSPYYRAYLTGRYLTFSSDTVACLDELDFISYCSSRGQTIDFSLA